MFIIVNENYININDISAITNIKALSFPHKIYYAYYVILKNGKEIEISSVDKDSLAIERMKVIKILNPSKEKNNERNQTW